MEKFSWKWASLVRLSVHVVSSHFYVISDGGQSSIKCLNSRDVRSVVELVHHSGSALVWCQVQPFPVGKLVLVLSSILSAEVFFSPGTVGFTVGIPVLLLEVNLFYFPILFSLQSKLISVKLFYNLFYCTSPAEASLASLSAKTHSPSFTQFQGKSRIFLLLLTIMNKEANLHIFSGGVEASGKYSRLLNGKIAREGCGKEKGGRRREEKEKPLNISPISSGKKDDEDETNMDQKWDKVNSSLTFRL
uniref:Uncharacterized protein n=1 Tax=Rhodnius prolixus TaxID=13249 RepID=T1I480_RHOPR